jgi:hypothetical protein
MQLLHASIAPVDLAQAAIAPGTGHTLVDRIQPERALEERQRRRSIVSLSQDSRISGERCVAPLTG